MLRKRCVLCDTGALGELFTLKNYPITPSSSILEASTDEFNDCVLANCTSCGCIQLQTLINPIKLYEHSHNSTEDTPTWKEHHRLFAEFVSGRSEGPLLEVGGNSGTLYRLLSQKIPDYTILDICDSNKRPPNVRFLQGNCEEFDFSGHGAVALSHTFEHLYSPRRFLENLSRVGVESVFISIPNMDHLYSCKNISVLHNEHTFFVGDAELQYLFSCHQYSCVATQKFKNHSLFYHFVYDPMAWPIPLCSTIERSLQIKTYLSEFEHAVSACLIDRPCFICPAGHYGQKIYYYLQAYRQHIMGFIDNDASKQGLRVYGTSVNVYSPHVLQEHQENPVCIILYAGPYSGELKQQLNQLHSDIRYIEL